MTGRERVRACLNFKKPDRAPRDIWALAYVQLFRMDDLNSILKKYPMDISYYEYKPGLSDLKIEWVAKKGQYTDTWGSVWYVGEPGVVGEVKKPALDDWSKLSKYKPPYNVIKKRNYSDINKFCDQQDNFVISEISARPFERLQFLRGTENLFIDIAYGTAEFYKLLEMVHEYYIEDIKSWCKTNVDALWLMDDWGANKSLLINPSTWREIFKPLYKEYCDLIHSCDKLAFFHTDGFVEPIFSDLINVGMDAINSQLFCMDIESIGRKYKGKVTFWGELDRMSILPFELEWGVQPPYSNIDAAYSAWNETLK